MVSLALRRALLCVAALTMLTACQLDTEEEARRLVAPWVFLAETEVFHSEANCTVARFATISPDVRRSKGPVLVEGVRESIPFLEEKQVVAYALPGLSPNQISEQLMSINLFKGLGLLSSFVSPGKNCMDETFASDAFQVLMSPDTTLIYDPVNYALVLLYRPLNKAFLVRTKS
ncbi:hypothetical protein [Pacificoceanicola onchidii]|uniref:hypothetical protein n=1 Tax=Pacificoceanicola onchidii TaxID=2562685 RepID=UPI0010A418CE|nr:hypothetical protein [Pacificoceanicola onchidii]